MLKIRLQRMGRRNAPAYRIVVAEHSAPIQGKFVEIVGHYIPTKRNRVIEIKTDRVEYWVSVGAQPSQTVARLCIAEGMKTLEKFLKARVMKPSKAEMKAKEEAEAKAKAESEAKEEAKKAKTESTETEETSSNDTEKTESDVAKTEEETEKTEQKS